MTVVFWLSLSLIAYAYVGYAILLGIQSGFRSRKYICSSMFPRVSIVMIAHNEERNLAAKLANLAAINYPPELIQIVVASDGSTDQTNAILQSAGSRVVPVILPERKGKAAALNHAVRETSGEVLIFFDTRQHVDPNSVSELVSCFSDPEIGAVSGELILVDAEGRETGDALAIYWRIEKIVRRLESQTASVIGVTGAIYALRRELYIELPEGTLLDDVLVPMNAARAGKRIVFQPNAIARDQIFQESGREFSRKVRTLTGNYQLLTLAPWLFTTSNPLLFRFVSHKLIRLVVPFLLVLLFLTSAVARGWVYRATCVGQLIFYGLAILGWLSPGLRRWRIVGIPWTFAMLNVAAVVAFYNFLTGRTEVWGPIRG